MSQFFASDSQSIGVSASASVLSMNIQDSFPLEWTGSKFKKENIKAVYCHPAYLTYVQSTSCEMLAWMKSKLESRLPGEISIASDMQMTPPFFKKFILIGG